MSTPFKVFRSPKGLFYISLPVDQVVGLVDRVKSVREVIEDIISEAEVLLNRLNNMTS